MASKGQQQQQRSTGRPGGTSPPPAVAHDRLVFLLLALVGSKVTVTLKGGARFSGILSAATTDGEVNLALRQVQLLSDPSAPLRSSLLIQAKDLQEVQADEVSLDARTSERDSFKTDEQVTGVAGDRREKQLQAWGSGSGAAGGIEDDGIGGLILDDEPLGGGQKEAGGKWDQFATNERLYGTRTDYHEELYTTKLDRSGADYRAREQRAAQLEREILKGGGLSNNAHVAEERGEVVDDSGLNEEDRYSTVIRGPDAYVPPGARGKTPLSRSAVNGSTNGSTTTATPPPTASLAASAASAKAQDPSIISVSTSSGSRLPVSTSATSRIPAQVPTDASAAGDKSKMAAPTVEGSFRHFVTIERQRLTEKKAALAKEAQRQDKDSKLASLLEFSQTFKLKSPMPADIAEIAGHGKAAQAAQATASAASSSSSTLTPGAGATGSVSTATSPVVSPARLGVSRTLTPAAGGPPQAAAPRFASGGKPTLIAEIPPFNPNRAKKAAEAASGASAAGSEKSTAPAGAAAATSSSAKSTLSGSKINPNAPAFVFRPNPNASSFTPGFTPSSSLSASVPAGKAPSMTPQQPINPFFGTKQLKKGSASMHVKEDFTPFKNAVVGEPATIVPTWTFTGKPYRSMYPPSPTPPPMMGLGEDESQPPMALHHPPPPPLPQGYGVYQQQFAPQQQPGYNPRFAPQPPPMHMPPQFQQFAPPPQGMNFAQPPGPPMFGSPQMQPSQQGAYMRYSPFPPGGPQQPPQQQQQQQQP